MNKKLMTIMLVIITSITLVGVTALVIVTNFMGTAEAKEKGPSIDDVIAQSYDLPEITTNLSSDNIVRLSFKLETDSKKAKEELEKENFK